MLQIKHFYVNYAVTESGTSRGPSRDNSHAYVPDGKWNFWISWANGRLATGFGDTAGKNTSIVWDVPNFTPVNRIKIESKWWKRHLDHSKQTDHLT